MHSSYQEGRRVDAKISLPSPSSEQRAQDPGGLGVMRHHREGLLPRPDLQLCLQAGFLVTSCSAFWHRPHGPNRRCLQSVTHKPRPLLLSHLQDPLCFWEISRVPDPGGSKCQGGRPTPSCWACTISTFHLGSLGGSASSQRRSDPSPRL